MGGGERKGECIYRKMMIGGNENWEMKEGGATSMEPGYGGREEREEDGMGWGRAGRVYKCPESGFVWTPSG
jgi:hypothetical protein